jgi:hypothetical protein
MDLLQELLRDRHQRRASLDHQSLKCQWLARLRKAMLVRGPPEALKIMDVVDDRYVAGEKLERDRGQGVREVVAVDEVGSKLLRDRSQVLPGL